MSLLHALHLSTIAPDHTGIFLLAATEMKSKPFGCNHFTVRHKGGLGKLTLGFDYLDEDYVERGEFENIHKNVGSAYSHDVENGWYKRVGEYVVDVVRLWKLIQAAEPFYADFQIDSVYLPGLASDLPENDNFVRWAESLVVNGQDMDDVDDALAACKEFIQRQKEDVRL